MTVSAQRDALLAHIVAAVDPAARVYGSPQYGDAVDLYGEQGATPVRINGWELGLDDPGITAEQLTQGHRHRYYHWRAQGYFASDDDPYGTMLDAAEAIATAVDADPLLGGVVTDHFGVQVEAPTYLAIGGSILVWGITLTVRTYKVTAA